ncbi:unnamed protein product [Trichogramma brassicae]|uniref:C2H2-type domain-containing protein n=1 Tax=Trichogramma brassicae TaxID=86971 RepID=A0A6H5HX84_9HYME|nr:unnamed protein product [Trichogramma brassicae]
MAITSAPLRCIYISLRLCHNGIVTTLKPLSCTNFLKKVYVFDFWRLKIQTLDDGFAKASDVSAKSSGIEDAREVAAKSFARMEISIYRPVDVFCKSKLNCYLKIHTDSAHNGKTPTCDICGNTYSQKGNLRTHINLVHNSQKSYECDVCRKKFSQKGNLQSHIDSVHHKITYACDVCGKTFSLKIYLKKHINAIHNAIHINSVHNSQKSYECDVCGKKFSRKGNLKTHIDTVHNNLKSHNCDVCEKKFSKSSYLKRHIGSVHSGKKPYKCDVCAKKFSRKDVLKIHTDSMHKGITYPCDFCGKTFSHKRNLKTHIDSAHKGITYDCDLCGKAFSHKSNLKTHIDFAHNGITYPCDFCEKTFSYKGNLQSHIDSVHNRTKSYECDACGKKFPLTGTLKIHIDSVHNNITYPCDFCGKTFSRKSNLKQHIYSIHKNITYPCDFCGKAFSQKSHLKQHIDSIHKNITYPCDFCGKPFSQKSSLKTHIDSIHKDITYPCDFCGKAFSLKSNLKIHIDSVHNSEKSYECDLVSWVESVQKDQSQANFFVKKMESTVSQLSYCCTLLVIAGREGRALHRLYIYNVCARGSSPYQPEKERERRNRWERRRRRSTGEARENAQEIIASRFTGKGSRHLAMRTESDENCVWTHVLHTAAARYICVERGSKEQSKTSNGIIQHLGNSFFTDATGSEVIEMHQDVVIFLTVLSTYVDHSIVPVAQLLSEKNDTNLLNYFLNEYIKSGGQYPEEIVTDMVELHCHLSELRLQRAASRAFGRPHGRVLTMFARISHRNYEKYTLDTTVFYVKRPQLSIETIKNLSSTLDKGTRQLVVKASFINSRRKAEDSSRLHRVPRPVPLSSALEASRLVQELVPELLRRLDSHLVRFGLLLRRLDHKPALPAHRGSLHLRWDGGINDIALVRVTKDIVYNEYVQPIRLAAKDHKLHEGSIVTITGRLGQSAGRRERHTGGHRDDKRRLRPDAHRARGLHQGVALRRLDRGLSEARRGQKLDTRRQLTRDTRDRGGS